MREKQQAISFLKDKYLHWNEAISSFEMDQNALYTLYLGICMIRM